MKPFILFFPNYIKLSYSSQSYHRHIKNRVQNTHPWAQASSALELLCFPSPCSAQTPQSQQGATQWHRKHQLHRKIETTEVNIQMHLYTYTLIMQSSSCGNTCRFKLIRHLFKPIRKWKNEQCNMAMIIQAYQCNQPQRWPPAARACCTRCGVWVPHTCRAAQLCAQSRQISSWCRGSASSTGEPHPCRICQRNMEKEFSAARDVIYYSFFFFQLQP